MRAYRPSRRSVEAARLRANIVIEIEDRQRHPFAGARASCILWWLLALRPLSVFRRRPKL
jgi:hypothetical protein